MIAVAFCMFTGEYPRPSHREGTLCPPEEALPSEMPLHYSVIRDWEEWLCNKTLIIIDNNDHVQDYLYFYLLYDIYIYIYIHVCVCGVRVYVCNVM